LLEYRNAALRFPAQAAAAAAVARKAAELSARGAPLLHALLLWVQVNCT
jgi:hypothetical protein